MTTWLQTYLQNLDRWEIVGWLGQTLFFGRFFVQWVVSEKKRQSIIPFHFWTMSIGGSIMLLIYVIHKNTVPLIVGQAMGIIIYTRNMMLLKGKARGGDG